MTEEEKAFLTALTENLNVNTLAIRRLNDVLQGLALAVERLVLPRYTLADGRIVVDQDPGWIHRKHQWATPPLACRALVTGPDGSGPLTCGRPSDDAIHDTSRGHVFRSE